MATIKLLATSNQQKLVEMQSFLQEKSMLNKNSYAFTLIKEIIAANSLIVSQIQDEEFKKEIISS